ncbi:unnamed protein product [Linum tenue]|uniref:Uncharacterized protein n=1 Tax=Linum tenue TaxID=586396 RepID=A0AAV0Q2M9_9ROSI|nr:unnamed protein product [Linum tenue]
MGHEFRQGGTGHAVRPAAGGELLEREGSVGFDLPDGG